MHQNESYLDRDKLWFSLWSTSEKVDLAKKEKNAMKSQKVTLKKSQKLLAENLRERPSIQNVQ